MVRIPIRPRQLGDRPHHRHGADGEHQVDPAPRLDQRRELRGDEALFAVRAVVGDDEALVADRAHLLSRITSSRVRAPTMERTVLPAAFMACAVG